MKRFLAYTALSSLLVLPVVVSAQFGPVSTFVQELGGVINNLLIPLILAIAFLVFIVGAVRFFLLANDNTDDNRKEGKQLMLWGIIAFVLIVSIWGIVRLFVVGLNFNDESLNQIPEAPLTR